MAVMPGITNLGQALAAEDLNSNSFVIAGAQVDVKIDPVAGNSLVSTPLGLKVPSPIAADFFRSGGGALLPDGANDYTEAITHNGFLGLVQAVNPVFPLQIGNPVPLAVCLYANTTPPNANQSYGIGVEFPSDSGTGYGVKYITPALGTNGHGFYGGVDALTSRMFMRAIDRELTIGNPLAPIGEGHWTIGTRNAGDDGYIRFNSPNAITGNKIQAQIFCNAFSGNGGTTGSSLGFQTADVVPGSVPRTRMHITGSGDVVISDPTTPYPDNLTAFAGLTVNGSIRISGGSIVPGNVRQRGGLTFGVSNANTIDGAAADTDGGVSSIADNDVSIFCNGVRSANFTTANAFKPGGGLWGALSDLRTKRDVSNHTPNPLAVLSLNPIEFYYNGQGGTSDNGQRFVGFSAQSLLETDYAHWVSKAQLALDGSVWSEETHAPEDQLYQVDSSNLVYELLGVIKTQQTAIDALTARLDALEKPLKTLKK